MGTSQPAVPTTSAPATAPAEPGPSEGTKTPIPFNVDVVELPPDSWLHIERLHKDAEGGWVTGYTPTPNRIVIETENVLQFSMDISRLHLDWSVRVWVRIDRYTFELTHKPNPVLHLRQTSTGAWELVETNED